jgi:murein DD-endopeptidase MepM/ murein hydrolase activator NlpD
MAGLALAGCTDFQPVHWGGGVPWEQARKAIYQSTGETSRIVPPAGQHLVMPGETVSELAVLYRVPTQQIIALNGLAAPYHIYVGQVLRLPQAGAPAPVDGPVHVVARGDTLSGVAATHQVKLGDVLALNQGIDPDRLDVGSTLRLPATADRSRETPVPQPAPTQVAVVEAEAPIAAPPMRVADAPRQPEPAMVRPAAAPTPEIVARPLDPPPAAVQPAPRTPSQDAARQRDLAAVEAPALSGEGFLWPLTSGELISGFGAKPDGRRNDGINIAAPVGSMVRAAENGLVVYADEDLAAFGRMLLIRHADGYLTAYAHNDALLVTRGDVVRRGQPIAKVGRTGEVIEPQLHFEIRRGKSAVDPVALLDDDEVRIARRD